MLTARPVRVIGYWRSREQPDLPDPGAFVDAGWAAEERFAVLAWLESRRPFVVGGGPSWWFRRWLPPQVPTSELLALLRAGGRLDVVDADAMHERAPPGVELRWADEADDT